MSDELTVTISAAAADGLRRALDSYLPLQAERKQHEKARQWIRKQIEGTKGTVTLTARAGSLLWLVERVVKPGMGYLAAASIIPALSERECKVDGGKSDTDCEWAMTGW